MSALAKEPYDLWNLFIESDYQRLYNFYFSLCAAPDLCLSVGLTLEPSQSPLCIALQIIIVNGTQLIVSLNCSVPSTSELTQEFDHEKHSPYRRTGVKKEHCSSSA
jgi:hypothetical protein